MWKFFFEAAYGSGQWRRQRFHRWFCLPPNLANVPISWVHHSITNKTSWNSAIVQWTKTLHTDARKHDKMLERKEHWSVACSNGMENREHTSHWESVLDSRFLCAFCRSLKCLLWGVEFHGITYMHIAHYRSLFTADTDDDNLFDTLDKSW